MLLIYGKFMANLLEIHKSYCCDGLNRARAGQLHGWAPQAVTSTPALRFLEDGYSGTAVVSQRIGARLGQGGRLPEPPHELTANIRPSHLGLLLNLGRQERA